MHIRYYYLYTNIIIFIMHFILKLHFGFGRRSSIGERYLEFQEFKKNYTKKMSSKYSMGDLFQFKDKLFQEQLHGRMHHICGVLENNFMSTTYCNKVIKGLKPKLIILGDCNESEVYEQFVHKKYKHPIYLASDMSCKQRMAQALQSKLSSDYCSHYYEQQNAFVLTIPSQRRIYPNPYLSVAYQTIQIPTCKLSFGKPSDVVIFEDLILRLSLQELKNCFSKVLDIIQSKHSTDIRYQQTFMYQTIRNYAMATQPSLFSKEVLFATALLHSYSKIQERILLFMPNYFVQQIAENVHKIDISPDSVFRINQIGSDNYHKLNAMIANNNIQEILQKFAILSMLKKNKIQQQFVLGENVFEKSIFAPIFAKYGQSSEQLLNLYLNIRRKYSMKINNLRRNRISNRENTPRGSTRMTIQQQLNKLQQRYTTFPLSLDQRNLNTIRKESLDVERLKKKMKQLVYSGQSERDIQMYEDMQQGALSKEGIIFQSKLIGRANVELKQKVTLPIHHYSAFRGLYFEYMKDHLLLNDQEEQRRERRMKKIQQNIKSIKQINDPEQIKKYISGEKGKVHNLNLETEDGQIKLTEYQDTFKQIMQAMEKQFKQ